GGASFRGARTHASHDEAPGPGPLAVARHTAGAMKSPVARVLPDRWPGRCDHRIPLAFRTHTSLKRQIAPSMHPALRRRIRRARGARRSGLAMGRDSLRRSLYAELRRRSRFLSTNGGRGAVRAVRAVWVG